VKKLGFPQKWWRSDPERPSIPGTPHRDFFSYRCVTQSGVVVTVHNVLRGYTLDVKLLKIPELQKSAGFYEI
jgi:hypothetical protein